MLLQAHSDDALHLSLGPIGPSCSGRPITRYRVSANVTKGTFLYIVFQAAACGESIICLPAVAKQH